jgi:hypothetical protein
LRRRNSIWRSSSARFSARSLRTSPSDIGQP